MSLEDRRETYFAAPLFTRAEKTFNQDLTRELEGLGLQVFLPQRDGLEMAQLAHLSQEEIGRKIFELDTKKVEECDVFIGILDGRVPDEGVCVEVAIAYQHRKLTGRDRLILGLQTDTRSLLPNVKINPLLELLFDKIFDTPEKLVEHVRGVSLKGKP